MRLFTAIELEEGTLNGASALVDELRRRVEAQWPRARLTWVPAERLHLTVRFIGEVSEAVAARAIAALRGALPLIPFLVAFDRLGAFPRSGPPRVLWIGLGTGLETLTQAERAINGRLASVGIPPESRPYAPHLTFARVRDPAGLRPHALFEGLAARLAPTRVHAITLFESRLSPKGPAYTVLQRTALRRPDAGAGDC